IEQGKSQPPYAWIIPPDQKDPGSAYEMLERLRATSVEVHLAKESFLADGKSYPKGTYILFCAQPCRPYIMDLMENQTYPHKPLYFGGSDDPPSAPNQSYVSAWTFPLQMGLKRVAVQKSFICAAEMIDSIPFPQGMVSPRNIRNGLCVVKAGQNDDYRLINRLFKNNIQFSIFNGGVRWTLSDGSEVPPGSIIIPSKNLGYNELKSIDKGLSCNVISTNNPSVEIMKAIRITRIPRLALYQPATSNTDEGWTRYVLENYEFPFTTLHDKDLIGGNLIRRFDCIILPSENTDGLIQGNLPGSTFPEYTGGLGDSGKNALKEFIEAGGNLVCIDGSCNFAIESFSLPVKNILINDIDSKGVENRISTDIFFCPGSLLRLHIDVNHPLGYGMNEEFTGFFISSQAFKPEINNLVEVVSTYGDSTLLESGWIRGEKLISGKPAILDISMSKGRVILLGFRIQHRAQMYGTFRILFNAIQQSTFDR
ncbi:MAG: hypothetical protein WAL29_16255, partial [Bacteroidales bacterium]